jgi:SOS-response transcriptional repressor LexA
VSASTCRAAKVAIPRERFPGLSQRAYCLVVGGDSLRPRFASGDVLVIDPDRIPKPGDFVVLYGEVRVAEFTGGAPGVFHVIVGKGLN